MHRGCQSYCHRCPDVGDVLPKCMGTAVYGIHRCTCDRPKLRQQDRTERELRGLVRRLTRRVVALERVVFAQRDEATDAIGVIGAME